MKPYHLSELAKIITAEVVGERLDNFFIEKIFIDSRNIVSPKNGLFIALGNTKKNGHNYINDAYGKGVRCFIVNEINNPKIDAAYLKVKSPLLALQTLAKYHREQYHLPIIGITGSNGKTVVKEWIHQILWQKYHIVRSPKSFNSQIGVPLSILNITDSDDLALIEVGISQPNEMDVLTKIIQPTIGILTNVGNAHSENFANRNIQIKEKINLFTTTQIIIYNHDDHQIALELNKKYGKSDKKLFCWGKTKIANLWLKKSVVKNNQTTLTLVHTSNVLELKIPFTDKASIENVLSVISLLICLGENPNDYFKEFNHLFSIEMRLEIKEGINNCIIINDSFNADLESLQIALDVLNHQTKSLKSIILTDFLQSNLSAKKLYQTIADCVNSYGLERVFLIGNNCVDYKDLFHAKTIIFKSTHEVINYFNSHQPHNEALLLKGSRVFELEKVALLLGKQSHDTVLEINLQALIDNINFFRNKLNSPTKIMCMVKAFSYGTGGYEIAQTLQHQNIDYLGVAYADEGATLRKAGIVIPIMVMNPEQSSYNTIIDSELEPEIYSFRVLEKFVQKLNEKSISTKYPIHIKIDTGMRRLGFSSDEIEKLGNTLVELPQLQVISIFSHLAATDELALDDFTKKQIDEFEKNTTLLSTKIGYKPMKHILNSAGVVNYPQAQYDMVRLGIGMYGYLGCDLAQEKLSVVAVFKTVISQIKHIEPFESVGYNRRFVTNKNITIAILPVGYADGVSRLLSNGNGYVIINNQKAIIIGNICMDMLMVDITNMNCNEGDEVIIFGNNPTIQQLAEKTDTIPYEILTSISPRVKRVYYKE